MASEAINSLIHSVHDKVRAVLDAQHEGHQNLLRHQEMAHRNLIEHLSRPKQVIRDAQGKIVGVK